MLLLTVAIINAATLRQHFQTMIIINVICITSLCHQDAQFFHNQILNSYENNISHNEEAPCSLVCVNDKLDSKVLLHYVKYCPHMNSKFDYEKIDSILMISLRYTCSIYNDHCLEILP